MALAAVQMAAQAGGNAAAAKVKNPVAPTAASIKTGAALYAKNCQFCHGPTGLGDGKLVPKDMKPANLTDATWIHGSTDGEIHAIVTNGIPDKKMPGVKGRISDTDTWNIVNYIRSLGPKTAAR
jgi:mono/diheme cytochrome c family protein